MIAQIKDVIHSVWNFIGNLLFMNTEVGGYLDGPQTLVYMILSIILIFWFIKKLDKFGIINIDKIIDKIIYDYDEEYEK